MPAAQREGIELVYDIQGDGPDLLLIAGTAADRTMWTQVRPKLSEYFRTIAFDNRDSGESTICNDSYVMLYLAKDAVAVLDAASQSVSASAAVGSSRISTRPAFSIARAISIRWRSASGSAPT